MDNKITKKNKSKYITLVAILFVISLAIFPLIINKNAKFGGADDNAAKAIADINPNYKRWASPIWEPPSSEIASLLFALQASIGTGFIAFYIGLQKGKKDAMKSKSND